jgi:hypothetical protein
MVTCFIINKQKPILQTFITSQYIFDEFHTFIINLMFPEKNQHLNLFFIYEKNPIYDNPHLLVDLYKH